MQRTSKTALTLCWIAAAATAGAGELRPPRGGRPIPDRYVVVLEPVAAPGPAFASPGLSVPQVATELAARHGGRLDYIYQHALEGFAVRLSAAAARALADDPRVASVEPDTEMELAAVQSAASWGLDRADQRDLPLSGTYEWQGGGAGVNVYVIDTGIRTSHVEFGGRARYAWSAIADGRGADDCYGHGTHVAGTIGGATTGIAKAANLWAVRVFDCTGHGPLSATLAAVDWVTANHVKPAVANMSLLAAASDALDAAVRRSIAAGVTYVVAAGNANGDACTMSPARVPEAITVGATGPADDRAVFSNWGSCLDLFAPGVGVLSSYYTSDTAMGTLSGTSMASPHVAGVAALYLQSQPGAGPAAVADAVIGNATPNRVVSAGAGSPNRLLYSVFPLSSEGPPCTACQKYTGTLAATGAKQKQPNGQSYFMGVGALHHAWLRGPDGTNFNLVLRYFDGAAWTVVAFSRGGASREEIAFYGPPGQYQWKVRSASGAGSYELWMAVD